MPSLQDKVFEKIHAGSVRMRPRMYFVAQALLIIGFTIFAFLAAVFFMSFVLFSFHESGEAALLTFGPRGFAIFLALFPWLIIIGVLALVVFLEWLLRSFRFGYRIPMLHVFSAVVLLAFVASVFVAVTPIHSMLLDRADHDALPVLGELYESVHASHKDMGVFRGTVTSLQDLSFVISHNDFDRDADDGVWTVIPPPSFDASSTLQVGDKVYVAGDAVGGIIHAYGIQKLPSTD